MTFTELKAKPGQYVWDEEKIQFVGRINKDGTEDKRFSKGGLCSLLNTVIEETGYVPAKPQLFASRIAEHRKSDYLVKGYGVVVQCYDLTAEMWAAKAAEVLGEECDGIGDILAKVSQAKEVEHKAKIESLALIFGKELKSKKLADHAGVQEFEQRLKDQRRKRAAEAKQQQLEDEFNNYVDKLNYALEYFLETASFDTCFKVMQLADKYSSLWAVGTQVFGLKFPRSNPDVKKDFYSRYAEPWRQTLSGLQMCCLAEVIANSIFDSCTDEQKRTLSAYAQKDYWDSAKILKDKTNE